MELDGLTTRLLFFRSKNISLIRKEDTAMKKYLIVSIIITAIAATIAIGAGCSTEKDHPGKLLPRTEASTKEVKSYDILNEMWLKYYFK